MAIHLWWIGEATRDEELMGHARLHVEAAFEAEVIEWMDTSRPHGTFDLRRGQHSSRGVLSWLHSAWPGAATRVLGVTDVDLFMPVLTFVFGEAQLEGDAAVVSAARLVEPGNHVLTAARLAKESVHELGHTFGLLHCESPRCVMARSASVRAVDAKLPRLCPSCRDKYRLFQQDGRHVYREDQNPHRR
jgi:archaemetzincin